MFNIELDISHEPTNKEVQEFATDHGCTATLLEANGPAGGNPLYLFQSEKFDYLDELASQVLGVNTDMEFIKTSIYEN
jgi:hypothetical protein